MIKPSLITPIAMALIVSGCAAINPVDGFLRGNPDLTLQAGSGSVKQAIGATSQIDKSSEQKNSLKQSAVERFDTSSNKAVIAPSIQASNIEAEKIQIVQKGGGRWYDPIIICMMVFAMLLAAYLALSRKDEKKEA